MPSPRRGRSTQVEAAGQVEAGQIEAAAQVEAAQGERDAALTA